MYIKREYCPGLHMTTYVYEDKKEAKEMKERIIKSGGRAKLEGIVQDFYDQNAKTLWYLKIV